jgi:crotonobetainyl-CoA:carnitine CoA-transferase CaiB-like acyl-CoA transferase
MPPPDPLDPRPFAGVEVVEFGQFIDLPHPLIGTMRMASTPIRLDGPGFAPSAATPPYGSEARQILAALGFSAGEVDGFVDGGVTRTAYPRR